MDKSQDELHNAKRDFYIVSEEKRMMLTRMAELQQDIENARCELEKKDKMYEDYEVDNNILVDKIRGLNTKEAELNNKYMMLENSMIKMKEEYSSTIRNLSITKGLKYDADGNVNLAEENAKLKEKKDYYKNQARKAQEWINSVIEKYGNKNKKENANASNSKMVKQAEEEEIYNDFEN